jgi:AcrR family transcriptional regulator
MTKNDIIDAAFEVWGQEFYQTTSLSKVAERLGVSKPALYRHFSGKEALFAAMNGRFYDDYTKALKPVIQEAQKTGAWQERLLLMMRFIIAYYARHFDYFIYSLIYLNSRKRYYVFNNEELEKQGISFAELMRDIPFDRQYPSALFMTAITALFETVKFHKQCRRRRESPAEVSAGRWARVSPLEPSETEIGAFVDAAAGQVRRGLGFSKSVIENIPFEKLEGLAAGRMAGGKDGAAPDPLLKAVAEAIAEAGPWDTSMETVAKHSGCSKSSLYTRFKNKREMLSQLFMTEFERIAETAAVCSALSARREERLYLSIFSITEYLKARPEILIALNWVRIQRLELDLNVPSSIVDFFTGLDLNNSETASQWMLFLLVSVFMYQYHRKNSLELPYAALRKIFRFLTLGIEGM